MNIQKTRTKTEDTTCLHFVYLKHGTISRNKKALESLKPELEKRYGVQSIGLFGSVVRDDFSPASDIDIIVQFNQPIGIEFIDLADYIENRLKRKVDLVSKNGIRDKYYKAIEPEIVYV